MRKRAFRRCGGFLCLLTALAAGSAPVHAGPASLLLDISTRSEEENESEVQGRALSLGSLALVPIFEPRSGRELWVSDGTDGGTRPLVDLCPGECSSLFVPQGVIGRVGIFAFSTDVDRESRLLRSDGTRLGTFPLTPETGGELFLCGGAAAATGSALFLTARTGTECGLWTTDGTSAGTVELRTGEVSGLMAAGGLAFFSALIEREGWTLWRTDGTPDGTFQLRLWPDGPPGGLVAVGARLFFFVKEDGRELWTSDGTVAGTQRLSHFAAEEPFVSGATLKSVPGAGGGEACFLVQDTGTGREVWCSDGTAAGTRQVTSLALASPFVELATWGIERLGGQLLFPANDGTSGNRWWISDGRPQSTAPLTGCPDACPVLDVKSTPVRVGNRVFFVALGEGPVDPERPPTTDLWVTDGTGAGTRRVGDFCDRCRVDRMFSLLGKLFVVAGRPSFDYDLWASDGTREGTRLLVPLEVSAEQILPYAPVVVGGRGLLTLGEGFSDSRGLWVSDGTPAGTEEVSFIGRNGRGSLPRDLVPAPGGIRFLAQGLWSSHGTAATTERLETALQPEALTAFGPLTLFRGQVDDFHDFALWRTDGTAAGTFRLVPENITRVSEASIVGNRAVFLMRGPNDLLASLWATDGTVAGTQKIVDLPDDWAGIVPGGASALVVMSDGSEDVLWQTDGTSEGTREIPLPADFSSFSYGDVARLGAALFFRGYSSIGERLWRRDGSETRVFATEIRAPGNLAVHAGSLYILGKKVAPDPKPIGLWRSDGTEAGTVLLASTVEEHDQVEFTSVGNLLFLVLDDERGRELWRTDGTPTGTFLVRDIVPGAGSSRPSSLAALNGRLYFAASSIEHGTELWESDGTEAGTKLVHDIEPGALSSNPDDLVAADGRLFFTADDGIHGREPWVYTPEGAGCEPTETALCLGGRFRVEADWRGSDDVIGRGRAVALTADTGYFWFFDSANVEVILKVLDGRGLNDHHWVFYGALSNVEYALTVTDTQTGATRRYVNPPGRLGSVADTTAFGPLGASVAGAVTEGPTSRAGEAIVTARTAPAAGSCTPSTTRLCLQDGRFSVEARWKRSGGTAGNGRAVPLAGGDTGYFWFFDASNVEVVLKVLDGRPLNGKFWVFYGALSDVEYTLTVTDTVTGAVKTYTNPGGRLASVADTGAF